MSAVVLDASAVLALVFAEPGADLVSGRLDDDAVISAVNWSEVLQKIGFSGGDPATLGGWVLALGLRVEPFDLACARVAASLYDATTAFGLGIADRACLALGQLRSAPVLTADRSWAQVSGSGVEVQLIR